MGIYVNPSNILFKQDIKSPIYVDKSMIIEELNHIIDTRNNFLCISRPRRFGKTMMTNLMCAFYSKGCDSRELFSKLKIAQLPEWDKNLNKFNVISFNLVKFYTGVKDKSQMPKYIAQVINSELKKEFPMVEIEEDDDFATALVKVYAATGEQFILIMDEYDLMVREKVSHEAFQPYLEFLNGLFKGPEVRMALHMAYLTGILPIVRDKIQSKLNEFKEYSMIMPRNLGGFIGFTEDEVQQLCESYNMSFEECKSWYNGYRLGDNLPIYNPCSVVEAMTEHNFDDYWTATGSYESISDYIRFNYNGLREDIAKMIGGGSVEVNVKTFLNTMNDFHSKDDVFTYLIHLGYLTYDIDKKTCWIPNSKIRSEWVNAISNLEDYSCVMEMIENSKELLQYTIEENEKAVEDALNKAHDLATNPKTYNNEGGLQAAICLAYFYAQGSYTVIQELTTRKGYADVVFIPVHLGEDKPAMIVELKMNKNPKTALDQIRNKEYCQALEHYKGNLLFVGINYDEEKKHQCVIEKFEI